MYHEATAFTRAYYDTKEELPNEIKVYFPNEKEPKIMTPRQLLDLSEEGWMTVMHSCNYGVCDHWISEPLIKWLEERFECIIRYVDKNDKTVGYNRKGWSLRLTKEKVWKSEVWNS